MIYLHPSPNNAFDPNSIFNDRQFQLHVLDFLPPSGAMLPTFARWLVRQEDLVMVATSPISKPITGVAFYLQSPDAYVPGRTAHDLMIWVDLVHRRQGIDSTLVDAVRPFWKDRKELRCYLRDHTVDFFRKPSPRPSRDALEPNIVCAPCAYNASHS